MPQPTFDNIFAKVPSDQVARLKDFRRTHPYKHLSVDKTEWQYISCGQGSQSLVLLPGALASGESMFPLITALENEYRIIAPSYPVSLKMAELCQGIARILEAECVDEVDVFGGSYGGLVAQYFVRRYPSQVRSLILSHTFVLTSRYSKPLWIAGKLFPLFPQSLLAPLLRVRLNKILLSRLRAAHHPETEFWGAYLKEAFASNRLKDVLTHQNRSLLDLMGQAQFTPNDLLEWKGNILIIESEDDPAVGMRDRALLRSMYPRAKVHTFSDAGHASSILKRDEVVKLIKTWTKRS